MSTTHQKIFQQPECRNKKLSDQELDHPSSHLNKQCTISNSISAKLASNGMCHNSARQGYALLQEAHNERVQRQCATEQHWWPSDDSNRPQQ